MLINAFGQEKHQILPNIEKITLRDLIRNFNVYKSYTHFLISFKWKNDDHGRKKCMRNQATMISHFFQFRPFSAFSCFYSNT